MDLPLADAVDRLLLDESGELGDPDGPVLLIDAPALIEPLAQHRAVSAFSDDARLASGSTQASWVQPGDPVMAQVALLRAPKSNGALDEYLAWAHACGVQTVAVGARIKDLNRSMNQVLARRYDRVWASRGRDKARVLFAADPLEPQRLSHLQPWPRRGEVELPDGSRLGLAGHGGTFGGSRLDQGTALLLGALAPALTPRRILDWGSGNGVLSAVLQQRYPDAEVVSVDVSWAGARASAATRGLPVDDPRVVWADGVAWLRDQRDDFDLIVSNPPFHDGVAKESGPTRELLALAPDRLAPGGEFWLVHNTHLPWLGLLREQRPDARRVTQDRQFAVLTCSA